jgi:hypothetical protein
LNLCGDQYMYQSQAFSSLFKLIVGKKPHWITL